MTVELDHGVLHVEDEGAGEPTVLIHGFGLDARLWDVEAAHLARTRRVIRYDLRGFGRSSLPAGPFSHADDLLALLDRLDIARAHLVGLSLGGGVALDAAIAHPDRVRTLVLLDSIVSGFIWRDDRAVMQAAWAAGRASGVPAARASWLANPLFAPALAHPTAGVRLRMLVDAYSGWHWVNQNPVRMLDPPALGRLAEVRAPTLVLVGELDLADFRHLAERLRREIPGARGRVLPGVGHMCNLEAPDLIAAELDAFYAAR
jgi:pimeloyl-ACP methyl ester carboxylesterase